MAINAENLHGIASLSSEHAEPEVCSHLRVYRDKTIILSWHDLPGDPFYVTSAIDEAELRKFCNALGWKYVFDANAR